MLAAATSAAVVGIDAVDVTIEVHIANGLPCWTLVGLVATAVKESRDRVSAALANSGFVVPPRRITVSLSPGDLPKAGTAFDLPIALGVLAASGQLDPFRLRGLRAVGELGLDGSLRSVRGVLAVARRAVRCDETLVIPPHNAAEAACVHNVRALVPESLAALVEILRSDSAARHTISGETLHAFVASGAGVAATRADRPLLATRADDCDMSDVVGQEHALRAIEIAAAGGHNILLVGPPGAGKTMLARRLPGVLPPLHDDEALEVLAIHSVAGLLGSGPTRPLRPFRAPHHSVSAAGLVGGGGIPRPGEVSLAHHGVLFLDELSLFSRSVLETLRQPMEDGHVTLARAATSLRYPARFMLVAATNPCPCGYAGDPERECRCSPAELERHRMRLSGPLSDRIDLHVHVRRVPPSALDDLSRGTPSSVIASRVSDARERQRVRYLRTNAPGASFDARSAGSLSPSVSASLSASRDRSSTAPTITNASVAARLLIATVTLQRDARSMLLLAAERLRLSARGYHRVLRVSRTIADLDGAIAVGADHVAEALRYRAANSEPLGERAVMPNAAQLSDAAVHAPERGGDR